MSEADVFDSAKKYSFNMRLTSNDIKNVKAYTDKNSFEMKKELSFDIENEEITSLEYFIGSIVSSALLNIIKIFNKKRYELEELEAKVTYTIDNPLHILDVQGYDKPAIISTLDIIIFVCADLDLDDTKELLNKAIAKSLIINSIKDSIKINIEYRIEEY